MTLPESAGDLHEMIQIISFTGDQMSAPHIEPFHPVQILPELCLQRIEHFLEIITRRLAKCMKMQSLHPLGKRCQIFGIDSEPASGKTRIIYIRLYDTAMRVDSQSGGDSSPFGGVRFVEGLDPGIESLELRDTVECDV